MNQDMNRHLNQDQNGNPSQHMGEGLDADGKKQEPLTPLEALNLLSPELIAEAADEQLLYEIGQQEKAGRSKRSAVWRFGPGLSSGKLAMAACLCLIAGLCLASPALRHRLFSPLSPDEEMVREVDTGKYPDGAGSSTGDSIREEAAVDYIGTVFDPSVDIGAYFRPERSTAKVSLLAPETGEDQIRIPSSQAALVYFTEEELFSHEKTFAIRGTVSALINISIDFNGDRVQRSLATIEISRVYRGDWTPGSTITMLLPCAIDIAGAPGSGQRAPLVEDTGVISQLQTGAEGIFFPRIYDETSYWEQNGAVLWLGELATCGLGDGMRWAFFETDRGIIYDKSYTGAADAKSLDEIEAYVLSMLP